MNIGHVLTLLVGPIAILIASAVVVVIRLFGGY